MLQSLVFLTVCVMYMCCSRVRSDGSKGAAVWVIAVEELLAAASESFGHLS